ncbi:MAG: sugar transferase [Crocinitomicaceae bacterium]|nr:sugar transferase [Crocinitomicaceae bacterium]
MKHFLNKYSLLVIDLLSSSLSWILFYCFRKIFIEEVQIEYTNSFYIGVFIIPLFWILIYTLQGTYIYIKKLFRIKIITLTIVGNLIGSVLIFFLLLLDDYIPNYETLYYSFLALFSIHLFIISIPRYIFTSIIVRRIQNRKSGFKTLIIGNLNKATQIYKEISGLKISNGNQIIGFINTNNSVSSYNDLPKHLGDLSSIKDVIQKNKIEEVIIAIENEEHSLLNRLIALFSGVGITIKIIPDDYDLLSGSLKSTNLFDVLLFEIPSNTMPVWQKSVKRMIDIIISLFSLLLLSPLYIIISIGVKKSSIGPVFYSQERIGKNGMKFDIIKFRTMYIDSEKDGPQLSSTHDNRITPFGRFLRKTRLDEFPQFINVLKGDMSLVGPRPERQFFIDKISEREPHYLQLTSVKPGITSWGVVKFGYAENIDQMIQRMKYDLLYIKNMSLALDFKIMFYTFITIIKAKGK